VAPCKVLKKFRAGIKSPGRGRRGNGVRPGLYRGTTTHSLHAIPSTARIWCFELGALPPITLKWSCRVVGPFPTWFLGRPRRALVVAMSYVSFTNPNTKLLHSVAGHFWWSSEPGCPSICYLFALCRSRNQGVYIVDGSSQSSFQLRDEVRAMRP
jgi:hypothetical protein